MFQNINIQTNNIIRQEIKNLIDHYGMTPTEADKRATIDYNEDNQTTEYYIDGELALLIQTKTIEIYAGVGSRKVVVATGIENIERFYDK